MLKIGTGYAFDFGLRGLKPKLPRLSNIIYTKDPYSPFNLNIEFTDLLQFY